MVHGDRDPELLRQRLFRVLDFYYPATLDDVFGGYVAQLDERTGHVYDGATKHLVATARAAHNFSLGVRLDGPVWCRPAAERGITFLNAVHWDDERGGFDWLLDGRTAVDRTRHCYGHAFVLLAASQALQAGIHGAERLFERAERVLDERFWEPDRGLYADRASPDWASLRSYRGQNANMHACEAHIAAYEATGADHHLTRAHAVADATTNDLTEETDGLLWEHYDEAWNHDFEYNRDDPDHTFRPWGYQPGHHVEWAKLLLLLDRHRSEPWLARRARELFDAAVDLGWDEEYGGFYYTVDRAGDPVVDDKYGWPVAEAIGASALLSRIDESYDEWYDRLWAYAREKFVDRGHGNWYAKLDREGERTSPNRGVAVEPGYHPIANYHAAMRAFGD